MEHHLGNILRAPHSADRVLAVVFRPKHRLFGVATPLPVVDGYPSRADAVYPDCRSQAYGKGVG